MDAYPEQSRRYPLNQLAGSPLDRYGTGPPAHAVSQVAARASTDPSPRQFAAASALLEDVAVGVSPEAGTVDEVGSGGAIQADAVAPMRMAPPAAQATTTPMTAATMPLSAFVVILVFP